MPKLLVVDDELDVREFSRSFFRKRGIDVLVASAGREALDIICQESPDLVLLDIRMPDMTGIEVLEELKLRGIVVNVIIVSGMADESIANQALALGVLGFIHKPLILDELKQIVLTRLGL